MRPSSTCAIFSRSLAIHRLPLTRVVSALRETKQVADLILTETSADELQARQEILRPPNAGFDIFQIALLGLRVRLSATLTTSLPRLTRRGRRW